MKGMLTMRYGFIAVCLFFAVPIFAGNADPPETVMATFHTAAGKADEVERLIWQEWAVTTRLGLVANHVHHVYRGQSEAGETLIYDTFTWRDHATPDHAPPEVKAIWHKLNDAVEQRNGHPAIDIVEIEERQPPPAAAPAP
jgi:hypothetical protein